MWRAVLIAGVVVALSLALALGGVAGLILLGSDDEPDADAQSESSLPTYLRTVASQAEVVNSLVTESCEGSARVTPGTEYMRVSCDGSPTLGIRVFATTTELDAAVASLCGSGVPAAAGPTWLAFGDPTAIAGVVDGGATSLSCSG